MFSPLFGTFLRACIYREMEALSQNRWLFQSSGKHLPKTQKALCVLRYIHELYLWHIHSKVEKQSCAWSVHTFGKKWSDEQLKF